MVDEDRHIVYNRDVGPNGEVSPEYTLYEVSVCLNGENTLPHLCEQLVEFATHTIVFLISASTTLVLIAQEEIS